MSDLLDKLGQKVEDRSAALNVIGIGYVGLPVACLFAEAGFPVVGIDLIQDRVDKVNQGISPIEGKEPGLAELLERVVEQGKLRASTDYRSCDQAQIVLIAVETPVDPDSNKPAYRALRGALRQLGDHLAPGTLVIIESTIAPGTMDHMVQPILEEVSGLKVNQDFFLVNCPERLMPGRLLNNIRNYSRVVGGSSPEVAELAMDFYRYVVQADLDPVDCLTAELVKTMENAYRDVQIAFANEMALLCEDMGADVWQVRELVNKSPYRQMHLPGAGVGGHCIPKDPWLLIANASPDFDGRLIHTARAINHHMPVHVADMTLTALEDAGLEPSQARVAVLGYAYLENSDDTRNSPSQLLVESLQDRVGQLIIHDPFVHEYQADLLELVRDCAALVIMVAHDAYRNLDLDQLRSAVAHPILIDGRHLFSREAVKAGGWTYYGIGVGQQQNAK